MNSDLAKACPRICSSRSRALARIARGADSRAKAALTRGVSAAQLAPTPGEVVTELQSDSARTDSRVRVRYAQPDSASQYALARPRSCAGTRMSTPGAETEMFFAAVGAGEQL